MNTPLNSPYPTPPNRTPGRPPVRSPVRSPVQSPQAADPVPTWARPPARRGFGHVPVPLWIALGIAGLAFFVHLSYQQISAGSNGYSCSYLDFGGFLAAGAIVVLVVVAWASRAGTHPNRRLAAPLMSAATLLLVVLAGVHVLRGTGTWFSPCAAHPMP